MLCLFEDRLSVNFHPVALTRHVSHLLVGTMSLRRRAELATDETQIVLHARAYLREYYRAAGERVDPPTEPTLFVNARFPVSRRIVAAFPDRSEWIATWRGDVAAARLTERTIATLDWDRDALEFPLHGSVPVVELSEGHLYEYIWDLLYDNDRLLVEDFAEAGPTFDGVVMEGAHLVNRSNISIGQGTTIAPGAVLDAGEGPITIGRNVRIMANSVVVGPCFIGDGSRVKIGAKIYEKTAIGPLCKVGGEIENTIILGYSNKQHDGFLGHSYLGRWVNLGADTNTSDLKNNYGTIRVQLNGREVNTGAMFLGSLIGDHSKTGINTMLNTGTVIGVAANVFGGGFPPKSIPSFAWGGADGFERFDLEKAIDVARRVTSRRSVEFTSADERLLRYLDSMVELSGT